MTHSLTLQTAEHSSATASEKDAFIKCLDDAKKDFANIASVTTDGNLSIRAHMRKNETEVSHGLDVWHFCKNLAKHLAEISKKSVSR